MYEMKPEYYIGIDMIDEEHKQLFKYADEAYELLHDEFTPDKYDRIDIILENLRNYTVKHFSDEEQYMESINYKKIFTQKVQHQEFIHKLDEFVEHHNDEVEDQDEQIMGILILSISLDTFYSKILRVEERIGINLHGAQRNGDLFQYAEIGRASCRERV